MLGHSDVAPDRKQDPGELFDWPRLAAAGIGLWPADGQGTPRTSETSARLAALALPPTPPWRAAEATRLVIARLQRHFRAEQVDGLPDQGTLARLDGLLALLRALDPGAGDADI